MSLLTRTATDTLNVMSDTSGVRLVLGPITITEYQTWLVVLYEEFHFVDILSLTDVVSVSLVELDGEIEVSVSSIIALSDDIQLSYSLGNSLDEDLNLLTDSDPEFEIKAPYAPELSDYFTLSDASSVLQGNLVELADTGALSDALLANLAYLLTQSDTITFSDDQVIVLGLLTSAADSNTPSDAVEYGVNLILTVSDQLYLYDKIKTIYSLGGVVVSVLSLSDLVALIYGSIELPVDTLDLSDSAVSNLAVWLPLDISDSMSMADGVSNYLSDSEDDYYRRYLQDRNLMLGEKKTFYADSFTLSDEVEISV